MSSNKIGSHLEFLRLACGFSLRKAAQRSGLSHGYIRDVELGENRSGGPQIIPRPQTLRKFADAYSTDYYELMRIAGHVKEEKDVSGIPYCIVEVNLDDVLYVKVDENNHVQYHLAEHVYYESMLLHEYMLLEERLEKSDFLRVHFGTFVNLRHVSIYDEKNGRIFLDKRQTGKYIDITWFRAQIFRNSILRGVAQNNENDMEIKFTSNPSRSLIVRNINV